MIYLVLKETNQNLKKLSEEILFRYFLLYVSSENLTRLFYFLSFQSKSTARLARQCYLSDWMCDLLSETQICKS